MATKSSNSAAYISVTAPSTATENGYGKGVPINDFDPNVNRLLAQDKTCCFCVSETRHKKLRKILVVASLIVAIVGPCIKVYGKAEKSAEQKQRINDLITRQSIQNNYYVQMLHNYTRLRNRRKLSETELNKLQRGINTSVPTDCLNPITLSDLSDESDTRVILGKDVLSTCEKLLSRMKNNWIFTEITACYLRNCQISDICISLALTKHHAPHEPPTLHFIAYSARVLLYEMLNYSNRSSATPHIVVCFEVVSQFRFCFRTPTMTRSTFIVIEIAVSCIATTMIVSARKRLTPFEKEFTNCLYDSMY